MTDIAIDSLTFRKPTLQDGYAIYELVKASPPLDVNSSYLYFLQASHFADTCLVVEHDGQLLGFVSAYFQPDATDTLFVWQVVVSKSARGLGLAKKMLRQLVVNQAAHGVKRVTCTISPSNEASQALFRSFAEQYGWTLSCDPFIREADFGGEGHEAEDLYTVEAPDHSDLTKPLFT
ncbi:MAG: diaminobutyrate acetyltransferase [Hydrogenovibrio sp.]|uniref:diaminobutyrate acetyltransferase n=1 Tax=Hydrogenovibrio sp. TaxID=2065821 RepID=UPI0028707D3C|nr:diaminobutyrate acetyltransferase [Hydrogenovibrio sp.]MDR9499292.1 diaminobutyrate acetyltransferase [Hydrogenovibrio sp.]